MKVFLAGGGTGGHIYPALAIAEALKKQNPEIQVEFVGTSAGLESKIIPREGYQLHLIQSGKLNMSGQIFQKLKSLIKVPLGILQSILLILRHRPDFVIGVGGYVSAPFLLAAFLTGRRCALWEPNAHPGMANRILSRWIHTVYIVFEESKKYLKSTSNLLFGMPLRAQITNALNESSDTTVSAGQPFTILCFGGSQGSQFLNDQISDLIISMGDDARKIRLIHQTGPRDFERIQKKYNGHASVEVKDYIYNMPDYYRQADLLFCRGGASTLSEAAAFGVVPIVVPLPAADNHQQRNAESLVGKDAGFMLIQKEFDAQKFKKIVTDLMQNKDKLREMSKRLKELAPRNAAELIAADVIKKIKN